MSKFVRIKTELRDLQAVKFALDALGLRYKENTTHRIPYAQRSVPVALRVRLPAGDWFGLQWNRNRTALEFVADSTQSRAIRSTLRQVQDRIAQAYAHQVVVQKAQELGFNIAEQKVGRDGVIRLVVRRYT